MDNLTKGEIRIALDNLKHMRLDPAVAARQRLVLMERLALAEQRAEHERISQLERRAELDSIAQRDAEVEWQIFGGQG